MAKIQNTDNMLYYFKKGKNVTETQTKKRFVQCVEKVP